MQILEDAADAALVRRVRRSIARLGDTRVEQSYWTTFWMPRGSAPACAVEELVQALWARAGLEDAAGVEWWVGRSYTTRIPVGFHFDEDVKSGTRFRHPLLGSVFFFNRVRGGQLAITDQRPDAHGRPLPEQATRLQVVAPAPNRYVTFPGDLFHGVLDARGQTPGRPLPGPPGRMRVTLAVNYWALRPTGVPVFAKSRALRALAR